jgi:hypothetical protein
MRITKIKDHDGFNIGFRVSRKAWTPWRIEVVGPDAEEEEPEVDPFDFDAFFRSGWWALVDNEYGRQCEVFTLMRKGTENISLQLALYENGDAFSQCSIPALVRISKKTHTVYVGLLNQHHGN